MSLTPRAASSRANPRPPMPAPTMTTSAVRGRSCVVARDEVAQPGRRSGGGSRETAGRAPLAAIAPERLQAVLALARPGQRTGPALHELRVAVAGRDLRMDLVGVDVLAEADEPTGRRRPPGVVRTTRPAASPRSTARARSSARPRRGPAPGRRRAARPRRRPPAGGPGSASDRRTRRHRPPPAAGARPPRRSRPRPAASRASAATRQSGPARPRERRRSQTPARSPRDLSSPRQGSVAPGQHPMFPDERERQPRPITPGRSAPRTDGTRS